MAIVLVCYLQALAGLINFGLIVAFVLVLLVEDFAVIDFPATKKEIKFSQNVYYILQYHQKTFL